MATAGGVLSSDGFFRALITLAGMSFAFSRLCSLEWGRVIPSFLTERGGEKTGGGSSFTCFESGGVESLDPIGSSMTFDNHNISEKKMVITKH